MKYAMDVAPWTLEDDDKKSSVESKFKIYGICHITGKADSWTGATMHYGYIGSMIWSIAGYPVNDCCTPTHWELIVNETATWETEARRTEESEYRAADAELAWEERQEEDAELY